jgi:hypothetical protein
MSWPVIGWGDRLTSRSLDRSDAASAVLLISSVPSVDRADAMNLQVCTPTILRKTNNDIYAI